MLFKYCAECGHKLDDIKWYKIDEVEDVIARVNNCSGMHFDK